MFTPSTAQIFKGRHNLFEGAQDDHFDELVCELGSAFTMQRKLDSITLNHNAVREFHVFAPMTHSQATVYSKIKNSQKDSDL